MDLYLEVESALQRHGLTDADLKNFRPRRPWINVDEETARRISQEYEDRLKRWQRDVCPKIKDCGGLLATLQPLIREGARRNPESTVCLNLYNFDGYAYGRLTRLEIDGDEATGIARIKSRFGYFADSDHLDRASNESPVNGETSQSPLAEGQVVLDESAGLYCWMWEVARDIQKLARAAPLRMVIVGLPTGDMAVGPLHVETEDGVVIEHGCGARVGDEDVLGQVDTRYEDEEYDFANNGIRTVTEIGIRFQRINDRWLLDDIGNH